MAHPRHEEVRRLYQFRCGYCGVSEVDAGGQLTVDHYRPVSADGDDTLDNLIYCCNRCNLFKADFTPDAEQQKRGLRVLHPRTDSLDEHFDLDEDTGELVPLTVTGRFHIDWLHLNRPELVAHRLRALLFLAWHEKETALQSEVGRLRKQLTNREEQLRELTRLLGS